MSNLVPAGTRTSPTQASMVSDEQFLTFHCAGGFYGASILNIKEILQYGQITDVPLMPGEIRGVINLRGAVVPVIDLSVRFGKPASAIGKRSCIVIVEIPREGQSQDIGVLVDAVSEVLEIPGSQIEPAPGFGCQIRTDFIRGVGKVADRFVLLLDIAHTFSFNEIGAAVAEYAQHLDEAEIAA